MKYTTSIEIALPWEKVLQILADPAHLPRWLRGLVLHEPANGVHGELGTTSRVVFQMGKQRMRATETITRLKPEDLHAIPVRSSCTTTARSSARACGRRRATGSSEPVRTPRCGSEFRFDGLLMRLVGLVMPGSFRKQSRQQMEDFKAFAQHGTDVRQRTN
ncbi:SRPBCC family protein [Prauserella cavernicola]|uniref:SRPBCC family protein n=1 Tax=Prauserella cavernicola TaxID=2800127 RepID=A0A934QY64_9PSEU|nr:SRPBCC family protein [Prauserella cavernicola]MBK1788312.1 SRPBCC family protein [Prauserella cavernicola]